MTTLVQLAKQMQDRFKVVVRDDNSSIWVLKDDAPEWMTDVMYEVHDAGASLPNDTVYDLAHDCVNAIAELDEDADEEEATDAINEIEPEYRTWQLFLWAAEWSEYIDELGEEFGGTMIKSSSDLFDMFRMAQMLHIEHIGGLLVEALKEHAADEPEDDEEPEEEAKNVDEPPKYNHYSHVRILRPTYYAGWKGRIIGKPRKDLRGEWIYDVRLDDTGDEFGHPESNLEAVDA